MVWEFPTECLTSAGCISVKCAFAGLTVYNQTFTSLNNRIGLYQIRIWQRCVLVQKVLQAEFIVKKLITFNSHYYRASINFIMSIWSRISLALSALSTGECLHAVFKHLRTPPEWSVFFTIAVIALSTKMAQAGGLVTREKVSAFWEVFYTAAANGQYYPNEDQILFEVAVRFGLKKIDF